MNGQRLVAIYPDLESLSQGAAAILATAIASVARRPITIALSGGSTPLHLYAVLTAPAFAEKIPWRDLALYWGDERWVPYDDPESNFGTARRVLLDRVPIPTDQIHPIPTDLPTPDAAATAYEAILRSTVPAGPMQIPCLDIILLGMGPDGHTASLFPGSPALNVRDRLVVAVLDAPKPPPQRVTLTLPILNAAARVLFLVAGAEKAAAVHQAILGHGPDSPVPAGRIRPRDGQLVWLIDAAAARELPAAIPGWQIESAI